MADNILIIQLLAAGLFCIGAMIAILKRNIIIILMGIELMLNAANLSLVAFSKYHQLLDGQTAVLLIFAVAAAESAVGLSILIHVYRNFGSIFTTNTTTLRD